MKNIVISLISSCLLLASCAADEFEVKNPSEGNLHLSVSIPTGSDMRTRADEHKYSDGTTVNELKCYIYNQAKGTNSEPVAVKDVDIVENEDTRTGQLSLDLPTGQVYDVVFLATANPQDNSSSKVYYDATSRQLNVNYDKIKSCDEDVDCFYAVQTNISSDQRSEYKLTLRRPFAQLNIGTKDMDTYNSMASSPLKSVGMTVNGIYSAMNILDGSVVGDPSRMTIAPAALPSGQTYPVSGVKYLAMNYLLVDGRTNVNVTLTGLNDSNSFETTYDNIPLQRNYQTNLYGNLLTADNDFTVDINPNFNGLNDKNAEDPWEEYDIVIQYTLKNNNKLYCDDYVIDLTPYIDDSNMLKATWSQLGLNKVTHMKFYNEECLYNSSYIKEVLKLDINKLQVSNVSQMFKDASFLINISGLKKWNTSQIEDMSELFSGCNYLESFNIDFDTSKVITMRGMFYKCSKLKNINVSSFNVTKTLDMSYMFSDCSNITSLDLTNFYTSNLQDVSHMFHGCQNIYRVIFPNLNTSKVRDMSYMFCNCNSLNSVNIDSFDTSNVESFSFMFSGCNNLKTIDLHNFITSKVKDMSHMFYECKNISVIDIHNFDTSNVKSMQYMFGSNTAYNNHSKIILPSSSNDNLVDVSYMFALCGYLLNIDNMENFNLTNVLNASNMFYKVGTYTSNKCKIDFSNTSLPNAINLSYMFAFAHLDDLNLCSLNSINAVNMEGMFSHCSAIKTNIFGLRTSTVSNMASMFDMSDLFKESKVLPLVNFETSNVKDMHEMFSTISNINVIDLSRFRIMNDVNTKDLFYYDQKIITILCSEYTYIDSSIDLGWLYDLTYDSVKGIINALSQNDHNENRILNLSRTTYNLLSDEDIILATNKNWIISHP